MSTKKFFSVGLLVSWWCQSNQMLLQMQQYRCRLATNRLLHLSLHHPALTLYYMVFILYQRLGKFMGQCQKAKLNTSCSCRVCVTCKARSKVIFIFVTTNRNIKVIGYHKTGACWLGFLHMCVTEYMHTLNIPKLLWLVIKTLGNWQSFLRHAFKIEIWLSKTRKGISS